MLSKLQLDPPVTACIVKGKIKKCDDPAIAAYVGYLLTDGQKLLLQLNYAPLPASIRPGGQGAAIHDRLIVGIGSVG